MEMNDLQQRSLPETAHRSRQIAKAMLEGSGKEVSPSLLNYARRAELQLIAIERARFNGSYANEISDHIFRTENGSPAFAEGAASRTGPTIGEAVSRFLDEEIDILKPSEKTARKYRSVLDQITRHFGADHPISELNRTECRAFRDIVARLPSNFTKRFGPSKSLREIAAQTDEADPRLMAYNTQLTYVQLLCRFSAWCSAEGFLTADPAKGLRPRAKRRPRNELRDPFGLPELRRIFNAPLYVGSVDDQRRLSIPGPNVIRRSRFWLPLISLFSGMREGEILNLQVHDILRSPKGTPYFALFRMGELKTPQSSRQIPVHRELQKIGFLDFVEKCRNSNKTHIFDDVPPGSDGYRSSIFTKRFRTFADSLKLKNANQMTCFHSFRHNFADAVNASGAPEEDREALGGWSRARKSSRSYGFGFDADRLALTMNAVIYEGLDLSHLYKQTP